MSTTRQEASATLLGNGKVLVAGGFGGPIKTLASVELYDPSVNTWTAMSTMLNTRRYHTATILGDGTLLVAGGLDDQNKVLATAELLFVPDGSSCILNTDCQSGSCAGGVCIGGGMGGSGGMGGGGGMGGAGGMGGVGGRGGWRRREWRDGWRRREWRDGWRRREWRKWRDGRRCHGRERRRGAESAGVAEVAAPLAEAAAPPAAREAVARVGLRPAGSGGETTTGTGGVATGGNDTGGGGEGGKTDESPGGCGCDVERRGKTSGAGWIALILLLAWRRRSGAAPE